MKLFSKLFLLVFLTVQGAFVVGQSVTELTDKDEYFLNYYNMDQPRSQIVNLPETSTYTVEIINAWDMTITQVQGEYRGKSLIQLPQKPFTALRITKIKK